MRCHCRQTAVSTVDQQINTTFFFRYCCYEFFDSTVIRLIENNGLYYTASELETVVKEGQLHGVDVKTEHAGNAVGKVVSSFLDDRGTLQCVMQVDESTVEGALVSGFVRDGIAADLSLGYTVDIRHSQHSNSLKACGKNLLEVSIVRRGARDGCHISVYEDKAGVVYVKDKSDPWNVFDMS